MSVRLAKSVMALSLIAMVAVPLAVLATEPAPLPSITGTACVADSGLYPNIGEFRFRLESSVGTSSASDTYLRGTTDAAGWGQTFQVQFILQGADSYFTLSDVGVASAEIPPDARRWRFGDFPKTLTVERVLVHDSNDYYVTQLDGVILNGGNAYVSGDTWTAQMHDRATGTTYSSEITITDCVTVPSTTVPSTTVPSTTVPSTTVPSTTVPSTTVPSTTVPPTTVPPTTTIPIDVGDTGGDSLPATGASEDLTRTAKAGIAFLLFGFTFLAASREARVVWKDQ